MANSPDYVALATSIIGLVTAAISAYISHKRLTKMQHGIKEARNDWDAARMELRNGTTERLSSMENKLNTALDLMQEDRMRSEHRLTTLRSQFRDEFEDLRGHIDRITKLPSRPPERRER